jgi:hypothetical protein
VRALHNAGEEEKWDQRRPNPNPNTVATADRAGERRGNNDHFEQLLEKPRTNHGYGPIEDTKAISVDHNDPTMTVRIGA